MRVALISDIHSNLPALETVLAAIEAAGIEERWCLGDIVGYGADPDECTRLVSQSCSLSLVGNHDLAAIEALDIATFSQGAAMAAEWTRTNASEETMDFLRSLEPLDTSRDDIALYHASPRDPIWEYVLSVEQAAECMSGQAARISFIGHSHVALYFRQEESGEPEGAQVEGGTTLDITSGRWLINPGSVGQPRDGDPRAAWLELDTDTWSAKFHRLEYDIDRAAHAIVEAGLPGHLAERLYSGQ